MKSNKKYDRKDNSTQTKNSSVLNDSLMNASFNKDKDNSQANTNAMNNIIDELKIDLQVKENLIESINDTLVLKEAEIARLKTRIGILERKQSSNEPNN